MERLDTSDLMSEFREARGQTNKEFVPSSQKRNKSVQKSPSNFVTHRNVSSDKYQLFLRKYWDLDNSVDSFTPQDLMYYFREKATESGIKYVISNMKRDMGIFKKLRQNYSVREVCLMIEFVFTSEQNYLNTKDLQPTVLVSTWCNTIYRDAMLWVEDKYVPRVSTAKKQMRLREWGDKPSHTNASIGEW